MCFYLCVYVLLSFLSGNNHVSICFGLPTSPIYTSTPTLYSDPCSAVLDIVPICDRITAARTLRLVRRWPCWRTSSTRPKATTHVTWTNPSLAQTSQAKRTVR